VIDATGKAGFIVAFNCRKQTGEVGATTTIYRTPISFHQSAQKRLHQGHYRLGRDP
jgi:hypothetical protein